MKTLWNSLVQPHLDYYSQLWMPLKVGELQEVEQIQRYYTNMIHGLQDLNYWERVKYTNMRSLFAINEYE